MCCLRDVVIFLAGVEFFHTMTHIWLSYMDMLPIQMKFMVLTSTLNNYAIVGNAVVTVLLLWWAMRLHHKECAKHKK